MGEGYTEKFIKAFNLRLFAAFLGGGLILMGAGFALIKILPDQPIVVASVLVIFWAMLSVVFAVLLTGSLAKPMRILAQAILHISPNEHLVAAPNVDELGFGRELVASLTRQVYDFATTAHQDAPDEAHDIHNLIDELPVTVIGINDAGIITLANNSALNTFQTKSLSGLELANQLSMEFQGQGLKEWLAASRANSVSATKTWQKVDVRNQGDTSRSYFDISAVFRRDHPSGTETLLVLFAHDEAFNAENDALSLISLAVHEIRTPLTILRGYIEALQDEMDENPRPEHLEFMNKMSVAAANLSAFVSNVLNVAKADQNQLSLQLLEESWPQALTNNIDAMKTRAHERGKEIKLDIDPNLPAVAIDKISLAEVITNLIDNAIKYSPEGAETIWVHASLDNDGNVLTTVKDQGVGIPDSVVPNLFSKFYRNHRNRNQVTGTGLGLYVSKAIISAHHGNIWVKSKEGEGSEFGFTLIPYAQLDEEHKKDNNGIIRTSHGWIKNHSMQRR